jgi:3-oxoacyl-[acyl-carrier protein] reductase
MESHPPENGGATGVAFTGPAEWDRRQQVDESIVDLKGKTALVTGASRGIGRAIALGLGRCGAAVMVNYYSKAEAATELVEQIRCVGGRAHAVQADVGSRADIDRMFKEVRRIFENRLDILINNAGGPDLRYSIAEMPEEVWDRVFSVNLKSAFLCTQLAWPLLPDGSGRIINVTSISARTGGGPNLSHYAAAKAGLSNFTRACAKEFAARRITVNGLAPGVILTDLHRHGTPKDELENLEKVIPLHRLGNPDEVADVALFLCRPEASYITGEIIEINGGLLMN